MKELFTYKKYRVGYIIKHRGNEWAVVEDLKENYDQKDAKEVLQKIIDEGFVSFQGPPVHSRDGKPELGPFHDAMVEQIKEMLDEIESEIGDEIYDEHENLLCQVGDIFHDTRVAFESQAQEMRTI